MQKYVKLVDIVIFLNMLQNEHLLAKSIPIHLKAGQISQTYDQLCPTSVEPRYLPEVGIRKAYTVDGMARRPSSVTLRARSGSYDDDDDTPRGSHRSSALLSKTGSLSHP